jgi:hypothetical protein
MNWIFRMNAEQHSFFLSIAAFDWESCGAVRRQNTCDGLAAGLLQKECMAFCSGENDIVIISPFSDLLP